MIIAKEMEERKTKIPMPNEIFGDMILWEEEEGLKPVHREFIYTYYWTLAYLWRKCAYKSSYITQRDIKQHLGYNPDEKRLNYIIKKNGLLDKVEYTVATKNYPIEWKFDNQKNLEVTMLDDFDEIAREYLRPDDAPNYFVKQPLIHTGEEWDGLFWHSANSHMISSDVYFKCMSEKELGCAGFMLYGVLKMVSDKKTYKTESKWFECSNEDLMEYTGWGLKKVKTMTAHLKKHGLIVKWQPVREKGFVNIYKIMME